jgi:hypothetical protein
MAPSSQPIPRYVARDIASNGIGPQGCFLLVSGTVGQSEISMAEYPCFHLGDNQLIGEQGCRHLASTQMDQLSYLYIGSPGFRQKITRLEGLGADTSARPDGQPSES